MKKMTKWFSEKSQVLQEISQDVAWHAGRLADKAKQVMEGKGLGQLFPHDPESNGEEDGENLEDFFPVPDPWEQEQALRKEVDWAIHRAYYKEGGFRYFGSNLKRYVKVVLPSETRLESMWAAGYNSCIQPMLQQLEKLEKELEALMPHSGTKMPTLEKKELLEKMRTFSTRAYQLRLHKDTDWEAEAYRQALRNYTEELSSQLLEPYQLTEDE